jgi:hypothetical protein
VNDFGYRKVTHQGDQGYGGTKSRTICKRKPTDRRRIRKGKNGTKNISNIAIRAPKWRYLILMFVDDFVELNFSDRNFLNLRPYPDTNLAFHGVCPEALTIPLYSGCEPITPVTRSRAFRFDLRLQSSQDGIFIRARFAQVRCMAVLFLPSQHRQEGFEWKRYRGTKAVGCHRLLCGSPSIRAFHEDWRCRATAE